MYAEIINSLYSNPNIFKRMLQGKKDIDFNNLRFTQTAKYPAKSSTIIYTFVSFSGWNVCFSAVWFLCSQWNVPSLCCYIWMYLHWLVLWWVISCATLRVLLKSHYALSEWISSFHWFMLFLYRKLYWLPFLINNC